MAEPQPTKPEVDEEVAVEAKGAEDRKAAVALSALDASADDESSSKSNVDLDAMKKAMDRLAGTGAGATNGAVKKKEEKAVVKKVVKVDAADVATVVQELDLSKVKATELLKAHEGDLEKTLRAYITPAPEIKAGKFAAA